MKKKSISLLVIVSFCLTWFASFPALAVNTTQNNDILVQSVIPTENGSIFCQETESYIINIITDDDQKLISAALKFKETPATVYDFSAFYPVALEICAPDDFSQKGETFWASIINYMKANIECASQVQIEITSFEEDMPSTRSSAGADLIAELESEFGSEYFGKPLYETTQSKYGGNLLEIVEDLNFNITKNKRFTWSDALSIAGIITTIIGIPVTQGAISAISLALGVAAEASTFVQPGGIDTYTCCANYTRRTSVNGSEYAYNFAEKYYDYTGYENADLHSPSMAATCLKLSKI